MEIKRTLHALFSFDKILVFKMDLQPPFIYFFFVQFSPKEIQSLLSWWASDNPNNK